MANKSKVYASAVALRAALDERIRTRCRETGESQQLVRRRYAFEAFLRRVPRSGQALVLKGGCLMLLRYAEGGRLTKDLDTAHSDATLLNLAPEALTRRLQEALQAVADVPESDFFTFRVSTAKVDLGADREFVGYRFSILARLNQREFDTFQIDCTVGDSLVQPLEELTVGEMFAFAGLQSVPIAGISAAQHLAEKLHAICRERHGANNRVKDLFDVVVLLRHGVTAQAVAAVIGEVFVQAGQTPLARLVQVAVPASWRAKYTEMADAYGLTVNFDDALAMHTDLCRAILAIVV